MNIKTTLVLLVLLLGVGAVVFFSQSKDTGDVKPVVHTLVDLKSSDITRFVITGSDGKIIEAQKSSDTGGLPVWKLTQPVSATADTMKVSTLLDTLTSLKSSAEVSGSGSDAPHSGLDKPQYTVDLYSGSTDTKLTVGDRLTVSDGVYLKVGDHDAVDVVPGSVVDALDKPANDLRKTQLFDAASPSVQQLTVTHKDGSQLVLQKLAGKWQITAPQPAPAETSAVDDLVSSVINMTPVEFVDQPAQQMGLEMGLNHPSDTVTFTTAAPSTQPASTTLPTTMPGGVTVVFGGYDDVEKKNVFAQLPDGTIVKVASSVLDALNKKPFELRDKTVLDFDPAAVSKLVINVDQPATTQPVAAAVKKSTVLTRRKKTVQVGPALPTSKPVAPAAPQTDWVVGDNSPADGDDAKIATLLGQFHPLKADLYFEQPAAGSYVKKYTLTFTVNGLPTESVLTLLDPGHDAGLIGSYNSLSFQVPRTVATDLGSEFKK
jgi:hypothetical protein